MNSNKVIYTIHENDPIRNLHYYNAVSTEEGIIVSRKYFRLPIFRNTSDTVQTSIPINTWEN